MKRTANKWKDKNSPINLFVNHGTDTDIVRRNINEPLWIRQLEPVWNPTRPSLEKSADSRSVALTELANYEKLKTCENN